MSTVPNRETFESMYAGKPPWDIDEPQEAFVEVADRVTGAVLDAGCGTGENALFFAGKGHPVLGIDFLERPLQEARRKAQERGVSAEFLRMDALDLTTLDRRFDSVIDSGLFHVFSDEDRPRYVAGLAHVTNPGGRVFLLCFSDEEPGAVAKAGGNDESSSPVRSNGTWEPHHVTRRTTANHALGPPSLKAKSFRSGRTS